MSVGLKLAYDKGNSKEISKEEATNQFSDDDVIFDNTNDQTDYDYNL